MATSLAMKRMVRERKTLEKSNDDYIVLFKDDDLMQLEAYIIGPSDTLYSHKFIKLKLVIPSDYPWNPPKCTFIQHSGGRIHPNLYVEGKVCLSILGTWEGEKWAFAMTCETVLITIRSLLDNKPYTHEPHCSDNPAYNDYVQYNTWRWLMLDYLRHECNPTLKLFLQSYVAKHGDDMLTELRRQAVKNAGVAQFTSPYGSYARSGGGPCVPNYHMLEKDLLKCVAECRDAVAKAKSDGDAGPGTESAVMSGDGGAGQQAAAVAAATVNSTTTS